MYSVLGSIERDSELICLVSVLILYPRRYDSTSRFHELVEEKSADPAVQTMRIAPCCGSRGGHEGN